MSTEQNFDLYASISVKGKTLCPKKTIEVIIVHRGDNDYMVREDVFNQFGFGATKTKALTDWLHHILETYGNISQGINRNFDEYFEVQS